MIEQINSVLEAMTQKAQEINKGFAVGHVYVVWEENGNLIIASRRIQESDEFERGLSLQLSSLLGDFDGWKYQHSVVTLNDIPYGDNPRVRIGVLPDQKGYSELTEEYKEIGLQVAEAGIVAFFRYTVS